MISLHTLKLKIALALPLGFMLCRPTLAQTPETRPAFQPAFRADEFTDLVGLNASPFDRYLDSGPFKGAGTHYPPETFFDLGIRHYRTGLFLGQARLQAATLAKIP